MSMKQVLVGGGSGFIGTRLVQMLTGKGYDVTIISRMCGHNRITWHDLESKGLPKDTIAVVNLAGQNVLDASRRWTPGFKQNVWNSRVNTTACLANAITKSDVKPKTFITISGVSSYKPNNTIYTESDVCPPYDFMSKLCHAWEAAATLPTDNTQTRQIKIRSGVVIGRDGGMIGNMMMPFKFGLGGPIGGGTQPLPWIHITDLCNLIAFCIEQDKAKHIINGVAPDIITNNDFTKAFASSLRRPAVFAVPEFIVNLLFSPERAVLLTTGAKVRPEQAITIGFQYQYPKIEDACHELTTKIK